MDARMAMEWLYGDLQRTRRTRPWFDNVIWNVISILATHHLLLQAYGNLEAARQAVLTELYFAGALDREHMK
jgi:hypothetical protein